jgi:hypothetical protein
MTTALRPLSIGELLDRTFSLYRSHFTLFVGVIALPQLVLLTFQLAGVVLGMGARSSVGMAAGSVLWSLLTLVVALGVGAASQGATVIAVSQVHLDRPATVMGAYSRISSRILGLALIMIAVGIAIFIGFLLLIVPGVILALMWALTIPVAVLEDKGLSDSVTRSSDLTKGDRGRIFLIALLFVILIYCVYLLIYIPVFAVIGVMARGNPEAAAMGWPQVAIAVAGFISQCLVGPLMTIALTLVYYDERVRKEAFDLQLMMTTLDGAQAGAAPAI